MNNYRKRIAIAGGGISGLSAAYYIGRLCGEKGISAEIAIIESAERLGGKIRTIHRDGCVIEQGPDSFLARKTPIVELTRELGLEGELAATNPQARKTYILHHSKLHRMPAGLVLGIPTEIMPFVRSGLISPIGKARAALDLLLPRRIENGDEALGTFLRRRLGSEVLEHIAEPLLAGIYAGDTDELSLLSTFPQFQAMEREHRSLIIGMMRSKRQQSSQGGAVSLPPSAKGSMFLTYKRGLTTLVDSLRNKLGAATISTGTSVIHVLPEKDGCRLQLSNGSEEIYDAAVLAVPNYAAVDMLPTIASARSLIDISYVSVANVVMAFRKPDIAGLMNGSGFVVPRTEGLTITACTWTSVKWLHTAPDDLSLVRCYVGRSGDERALQLTDVEITERVMSDLRRTMGIKTQPVFIEISRWNRSMPQYAVGHLDRLQQFRKQLADALPGVFVTGSGYEGVGLPDCIGQAKQTAEQVVCYLENSQAIG